MLNKKVIIRGDRSGVFFGTLKSLNGQSAELEDCRKIWRWEGAKSVEQISIDGVHSDSRITQKVSNLIICDVIQILECTEMSISKIENILEWKQ